MWVVVFLVALAVRLIHIWQIRPSPFFDILMGDANGYDLWAQRLAAGDWIGSDVFYQAPLYPYFLGVVYAIFGRDLLIVRIVQAVIGAASCALLGMAGARFFSPRVGLIAGLALALWAPAIFFDGLIQKSVLDLFLVSLGLYLISTIVGNREPGTGSRTAWLALGASMGALALTRENALVFILVILIWAWFRHSRRIAIPAFVIGLALVLTPVVIRNYAIDGGFYLTTSQFGSNFYICNHPRADGTYASIRFGRGAPEFERIDAKEVAEASVGRELSPSEVSSYWTGRALGYITSQPLDWLQLTGRKILLLVNRTEMLDTESQESHAGWSTPIAVLSWIGHFGVLVPLALVGMIATWRDSRLWILHALTITYALSVVMFFVFARYRYPLVPLLLLFAGVGVLSLKESWKQPRVVAVLVVALIICNVPLLSPTLMQAITENNLGTALQEQQRYEEAIRHHERATALVPGYAPAYNNLGAALRASGRIDEAIATYKKALELQPDYPSAQNNLGAALAAKGDAAGAIAAFRAAIAIDDRSATAHRNLGNLLYDVGTELLEEQNFDAAAARFHEALKIRPDWPEAHNNLGIALASRGRIAEALTHFERAVQLNPNFTDARVNRDQARAVLKK
ncbi:MAG TPA: tetratricopeptide repeat protein [Vicinamibacterales bacterium]|nr:tetratricopeptide repeat protein [Vicinamibacterales bacterium]